MRMEEIKEIFEKNYKGCKLIGVEYLPDLGLYALNIVYDPEEKDPHNIRTLPSVVCINERTKEIELLDMLAYFDVENVEKMEVDGKHDNFTLEQAYEMIHNQSEYPLGYLLETEDAFWGAAREGYYSVNKTTGNMEVVQNYGEYLHRLKNEKYVYLKLMFNDIEQYLREHSENKEVADAYAVIWNRLFFQREEKIEKYRSDDERKKIISEWEKIEQELYASILERMAEQDYDCPPCVANKLDDPFYRIKPYMMKHGYTDNNNDRTWIEVDQ